MTKPTMFRLRCEHKDKEQFVKTTFCYGEDLAQKVKVEYEIKYGPTKMEIYPDEAKEAFEGKDGVPMDFYLDPGGMARTTDAPFTIFADGFVLGFNPGDWDFVKHILDKAMKADRGGYYKIHSKYLCLCLPMGLTRSLYDILLTKEGEADDRDKDNHNLWLENRERN